MKIATKSNILHFITGLEPEGGAEQMLLKTLPYLSYTKNAVVVLRGRGEVGRKLEERGVKVYYLDMKGLLDWGVIARYSKVVQDFAPDIQVNYLIHADIFGRIFGKRFGVKYLVSYIRNRHIKPLFTVLDRLTLRRVDYLLTNSEAVLRYYRDEYRFPENKSQCIANGIDIAVNNSGLNIAEFKQSLGVDKNDFVVSCVASLSSQKNHKILLRAVKILQTKQVANIKFLLVGDGAEKNSLVILAKRLGVSKQVVFLGKRADVARILQVSNCFVLPSLHEGMSNALLEAMSHSLPCVVSAIPENTELIEHNINGLVFNREDSEALSANILFVKSHPEKAREFGAKARVKVEKNYDIKKIIRDLDNFLQKHTPRKKIVWVTNSPNDIYFNLFEALGDKHPDLDLSIILGSEDKNQDIKARYHNFKIKNLQRGGKSFLKIIFAYRRLKSRQVKLPNISFLKGLKKYLKKEKPDLIMANLYFNPSSWQSYWAAKRMRVPFVLFTEKRKLGEKKLDQIFTKMSFVLLKPMFSYLKYIFCWTNNSLDFAWRNFPVNDKNKIKLLAPGVDTMLLTDDGAQPWLLTDDGNNRSLKILMVARFVAFKRHEDVLKAIKHLEENDNIDLELNLVGSSNGDDPLKQSIKDLARELKIASPVNFLDNYSYDKMPELYRANDIHILASHNEPIGMVVPESMACGLPNIVSDSSGAKAYIQDGSNGYIFKTFDYRDLADKIKLLANKATRENFSRQARQTMEQSYDIKIVENKFYQIIKEIL